MKIEFRRITTILEALEVSHVGVVLSLLAARQCLFQVIAAPQTVCNASWTDGMAKLVLQKEAQDTRSIHEFRGT